MDPYHHAYHSEISPFISALSAFQTRIHSFEYQDNATLQKLVQLSQKIQQLPLTSPLMRWLIGLETLLGKVAEWEQSAASFVSLKGEMASLSKFVIRWRKIELESWSMVLDRRTKEARKKTSALWFHLHESVLQAQKDSFWGRKPASWVKPTMNIAELTKSKLDVFKLLDEFCRLSTLGDFALRCELLQAFANYCQVSNDSSALSCTLRNLGLYYEQFTSNCKQTLDRNRAPIQTKLENQVKISSWDDRNYFALKESADKSHRIILRLAKEFDLVLESPVHLVFEQTAKDYVTEEPKVLGQFSLPQSPAILLELAPPNIATGVFTPIYRRAKELVEHRIANNVDLCENHEIPRELFETIKERLQSLDKDSPIQWKKRALVDLFNEFKSQLRGAPPIPHRLRDFQELFACEWLLEGTSQTSLFVGLFHLNHLRNLVRSPVSDRSEDLSQEECNRGVGIGESMMLMILQQRESLVELHQQRYLLENELGVWDRIALASTNGGSMCVFIEKDNIQVQLELDLVIKGCRDLDFLCKQLVDGYTGLRALQILPGMQEEIAVFKLERCCAVSELQGFNARFRAEIQTTLQEVIELSKQVPSCDKLVVKIESLLGKEFAMHVVGTTTTVGTEQGEDLCGKFVQACQLMLQPLALAKKNENQGLRSHHDWMLGCNIQMRSNAFVRDMGELTSWLLQGQVDFATLEFKHNLLSLVKLVRAVLEMFYQALLGYHNALCRLQEFILKLFRSVVERGFCRPPEEEDGAEEGVDENLKDGTGMGEGQGQENVSKEIEDEEQILGLKGDKQDQPEDKSDKPKPEQEEEQDGVEMENDFDGGEMHDMEREDEEKEEDEEEEDDKDKEELDRDMGDTGEESQTVDEKLWDEKEDEKTEDEKFEDNAPMKGKEQELRSKEDKPNDEEDKEEKSGKKKEDEDEDEGGEKDEEEDDDGFKAEEIEESSGLEKEQEEEEEEGDDKMPEMEGKVGEEDNQVEPEDFEMPEDAPAEDDDNDGDGGEDAEDLNELAEESSGDEDENKPEDDSAPPEPEESDGRLTLPTQANEENESKENQEVDNDAFLGQGTTSNRNNNNDNESAQDQLPKEQDDNPGISNQTGGTSGGAGGERFRKGGEPEDKEEELDSEQAKRKDLNPWRDPGDASKEWSRRKKIVETVGEAEDGGEMDENADHQTVEYKKKDQGEDTSEQALGPRDDNAQDEERVNMEEEEEKEPATTKEEDRKKKKKEEEESGAELMQQEEKTHPKQKPQPKQAAKRGKFFEDLEESSSEDEDGKEVKDKEEDETTPTLPKPAEPFLLFTQREDQDDEEREQAKLLMMQQEVEIADLAGNEVDSTLLSDLALERGRLVWQRAVNETYESAQHLCEQLRLVLEPTTATKLKGDYRTGTRINMRRVIAYIASGYKKDKIWQKRSKPSRRKYHIALAIDDSKSMKPCKDLALAALALITRALTQLEVGEVGVWSFGEDVKKLHDLSKPFSEISGALVSAHFGFDQNSTCIEQGLSTVIDTLTTVSASSGNKISELPRQLVFIISDGRFDTGSRPKIAKLLRVAKERKQLVALIVVEPEEAAESILDVRQVSFKPDGGGVVMNRYLEDYPFPYYIVLRDMQALPEVLADGLKQWFELIVGDTA
ncbi:hypothetical protein BASA81_003600 [Batrachochytrium salamandrivorans]|nr:hypothetical protein BASA81_003600 [Batrachochytrium salamandrivorans]